jgi:hypothetical protein
VIARRWLIAVSIAVETEVSRTVLSRAGWNYPDR